MFLRGFCARNVCSPPPIIFFHTISLTDRPHAHRRLASSLLMVVLFILFTRGSLLLIKLQTTLESRVRSFVYGRGGDGAGG